MTMLVTVFVGISLDGFLARSNHDLDWLPHVESEPLGFEEFFSSVDVLVVGRNTFEKVLTFEEWPYGDKRIVVLSTRPLDLSAVRDRPVELFGPLDRDVRLQHVSTRAFPSGMVQSEYRIAR
jgi:dihydrofolate reductase